MLRKKYIKYNSEITYEVFQQIWNKLTSSGWECSDNDQSGCYKEFSDNYPYLIDNSEGRPEKRFMSYDSIADTCTTGHIEISYKDFLSKDIDLIAKAKKDYPVGTKIKSIASGDTFIITSDKFVIDCLGDVMGESDRDRTPTIYSKKRDKWSEILQKVTQEDPLITKARKDYPTGTKFHPLQTPDGKVSTSINTVGTEYSWHSDSQVVCNGGNLYVKGNWAPIVTEDLLEKARKEYPGGTIFKSAYSGSKAIIRKDDSFSLNSGGDVINKDGYILYYKKLSKWGEIITVGTSINTPKFKVGDTVRVTKRHSDNYTRDVGYIGKLTKIDSSDVPYQVDGTWCKNVELVEVQESISSSKPKVKIGDKVRVIKEKPNSGNTAVVGYIGKLTHIDNSDVPYAVDGSWCVDVELYNEPVPKEWWKELKDGDFVVSLSDYSQMRTKNFVYKIQDQTRGHKSIRYIRDNGGQGGTDDVHDFRLATSEEAALYKQAGKPCSINPPVKNLPSDKELLEYANKHFIIGTKFISIVPSDGKKERTCNYYKGESSFKWAIGSINGIRTIRANNGLDGSTGCSNPYIYTDTLGWAKITYDASLISPGKRCVHITTQEEWDIVLKTIRKSGGYYNSFNEYSSINPGCLVLSDGCHSSLSYFMKEGYEIITYTEWARENNISPSPISSKPNFNYKLGDCVIYKGELANIIAISYDQNVYIVNYSSGWVGSSNRYTINEGYISNEGHYHYAREQDIILASVTHKSAMLAQEPIDDLMFISDTLDMPIKRKFRSSKKQTELKFTNN